MEKEPKNKTKAVKSSNKIIQQDVENPDDLNNNDAAETVVNIDAQPVVVKKSSAVLSLMLSLLALAGVGYLSYKDWQNSKQTTNKAASPAVIQQLQDSDQVLSTDLQNLQVDINQVKQQTAAVEQQLKQLTEQLTGLKGSQQESNLLGTDNQFDNSGNETLLAELQQQITEQAVTIKNLQTITTSAVNMQTGAFDKQTATDDQIEKNAAIQVLLTTDVLLTTHRLPQAISTLDNYLKVSSLKAVEKNKIIRLVNQLQQIDAPDVELIEQQLQGLKSTVNDLQVATQKAASDAPKWYERFVSVKKIETENSISSTAQMVAFKTELNRLLYQAQLYLMLNDQNGWQSSLNAAMQWVKDELPENNELAAGIAALANQQVVADIPNQVNITTVIEDLKGLR